MSKQSKKDTETDEFNSETEEGPKGIGDMFKRIASVGMGAAFMTEESIKGVLNDLPVSKEIVSGLVQNARGAKEDFTNGLREEFSRYLSRLDKEGLIDYIAENYDVEVNASFKLNKRKKDASDSSKETKKTSKAKSKSSPQSKDEQ